MFTCYLFDDFVATKASDKFSWGSYSEVSLQIDTAAIPALLHQVQPRHARPVLKNTKNACNSNSTFGTYSAFKRAHILKICHSYSGIFLSFMFKDVCILGDN